MPAGVVWSLGGKIPLPRTGGAPEARWQSISRVREVRQGTARAAGTGMPLPGRSSGQRSARAHIVARTVEDVRAGACAHPPSSSRVDTAAMTKRHAPPPPPPAQPRDTVAERIALAVVIGRRLLWLVAGVALMRWGARGLHPGADATVVVGNAFLAFIGVGMIIYSVRSAARAVLDIDGK